MWLYELFSKYKKANDIKIYLKLYPIAKEYNEINPNNKINIDDKVVEYKRKGKDEEELINYLNYAKLKFWCDYMNHSNAFKIVPADITIIVSKKKKCNDVFGVQTQWLLCDYFFFENSKDFEKNADKLLRTLTIREKVFFLNNY